MKPNEIPEIAELHLSYRKSRNATRKALNKVQKAKKEFYFIDRLRIPREKSHTKDHDTEYEIAVMNLFKNIGFSCNRPDHNFNSDVKAKFKKEYFGIEVKNGGLPKIKELSQPDTHKVINGDSYKSIIVFNNFSKNHQITQEHNTYATRLKIGLISSEELLKGFLKLKNNIISLDTFIEHLNKNGKIKFSNKELGKAYKSESPRIEG